MTAWARFLEGLLGVVGVVVGLFRERQARKDGAAVQVSEDRRESLDAIQKATAAGDAVVRDIARNPGLLDTDDGFKRD